MIRGRNLVIPKTNIKIRSPEQCKQANCERLDNDIGPLQQSSSTKDREGQMETNKPAEEVTKEGKTKEDLEEKTFAAINGYLTASANEGRYPSMYSKDQKRELRRKAKRFARNVQ